MSKSLFEEMNAIFGLESEADEPKAAEEATVETEVPAETAEEGTEAPAEASAEAQAEATVDATGEATAGEAATGEAEVQASAETVEEATVEAEAEQSPEAPATEEELPAAPEAEVLQDTVETAIIDNAESEEKIDELVEGVDEADAAIAAAEALYAAVEGYLERGGISDGERVFVAMRLEGLYEDVGLVYNPAQLPSLEAFGDPETRYDATVAALEDIGDFMKKVGAGISDAAFRALDAVTDHLGRWFSTQDGMIKRAQAISDAAAALTPEEAKSVAGKSIKGGRYARTFWFDGKVNSPIATAKRNQEVLSEIAKNWDPQTSTTAYAAALKSLKVMVEEAKDAEGNTVVAPKELGEGAKLLTAGRTLFKNELKAGDLKNLTVFQNMTEGRKFFGSKELPGGKIIVESTAGGSMDAAGNRKAGSFDYVTLMAYSSSRIAIQNLKGYAGSGTEQIQLASAGDIKTICKLVEETCIATKDLYNKRKQINSTIETLKKSFINIGATLKHIGRNVAVSFAPHVNGFAPELSRSPRLVSVTNAVMVGFTHLDDVVKVANKQSLFTSKVLLDYCDLCVKMAKSQKVLEEKGLSSGE